MARRKGKSNNKPDDSWLPLEPTAVQTRGFNEYVLPGVLFLFVALVGSGLGWVYNEQQQTIESLTETLASVQARVSKLQQQVGPGNAQLANVGGFEDRLVALEEAYVKAQRQVEIALATSEQIMSKDLHSKVWSLQTEMNSKLDELQQNTISIAALNAIIKNKSIELEVVKQRVNTMLTTNSELAITVSGLINSLSVTKSHLDEQITVVERLVSEQDGQKREMSEMKELFTSNQEELFTTAQQLMRIKDLIAAKHIKRIQALQKQSLHKSLKVHQISLKNVHSYPMVQTEFMPKPQQLSKVEDKVQVEEHIDMEYDEEHTAGAHKKQQAPKEETGHTDKQEFVQEETESEERQSTQEKLPEEHRTSEEKEMSEERGASEGEEKTEEQRGRDDDDEMTEEHGAREKDEMTEEHRVGEEEEMTEEHKAIEKEGITEEPRASEEEEMTEEHQAGEEEEMTEEHRAIEKEGITEEPRASEEEEMIEEYQAGEEEEMTVEPRAREEEEMTEEHRAGEEKEVTEEHKAGEEEEMTEEPRAREEEEVTEEHRAGEEEEMTEEHRVGEEEEVTEEHRAGEEEEVTEEHRAGEEEETTEEHRAGEEEEMTEKHKTTETEGITEEPRASEEEEITEEHRVGEGVTCDKPLFQKKLK